MLCGALGTTTSPIRWMIDASRRRRPATAAEFKRQTRSSPRPLPRAVCPAAATTQTGFPAAPHALSSSSRNLPAQECAAPGARWSPAHRSLPGRRSSRPRDPEDAPTRPKHRRPCQAGSPGATAVAPHDLYSWTKCIGKVTAPDRSTGGHPPVVGAGEQACPQTQPQGAPRHPRPHRPGTLRRAALPKGPSHPRLAHLVGQHNNPAPGTEPLHKSCGAKPSMSGMCPILPWRRVWLNQWTLRVASSRSSTPRQEPSPSRQR